MADSLNKGGAAEERSSAQVAALTAGEAEPLEGRGSSVERAPRASGEARRFFAGASGEAGRFSAGASGEAGRSSAGFSTADPASEPKRGFSAKAKAGIAALAFVALVCFGVSAVAFTGGFDGADGRSSTAGFAASAELQDQAAGGSADSADASAGPEAEAPGAADGSASSDGVSNASSGTASSDAASGGGAAASSGSSAASGSASGASGSSGSGVASSGSTDSNSGSGSSQVPSNLITVHVSVSSSSVGNPVSGGGSFSFKKGATVYDALCACGLSISASNTGYGVYVAAIGGLAEKEHGAGSGWMYSVNGTTPMTSCSSYRLSDGDSVSWFYSVG